MYQKLMEMIDLINLDFIFKQIKLWSLQILKSILSLNSKIIFPFQIIPILDYRRVIHKYCKYS